jgi:hypothetical protein
VPAGRVYAVELEDERSALAAQALPGSTVLAPCDFFRSRITPHGSFSLVWCNPPFDDEIGGGGRVEASFLSRCTQLLCTRGVMALVCPESVASGWQVTDHFKMWYDEVRVVPFPEEHRPYREVVTFGVRRASMVEAQSRPTGDCYKYRGGVGGRVDYVYQVPPAGAPRTFKKDALTQNEILRALHASPLRSLFQPKPPADVPPPPLELSKGQMALVLAGGYLDTSLQRPGEPPILIKATPYKEKYQKSASVEEKVDKESGEVKLQDVVIVSERIKLKVRVVTGEGEIHDVQ